MQYFVYIILCRVLATVFMSHQVAIITITPPLLTSFFTPTPLVHDRESWADIQDKNNNKSDIT